MSDASCHDVGGNSKATAILFDLDGTLTRPYFDFDAIRREIGLPTEPRIPVLEAMESMNSDDRVRAEAILLRHEKEAAEASLLWDDVHHVLDAVRRERIPLAVMTRNSRRSVDTVLARHGLRFDVEYTREDGPVKPSPEPVLILCRKLQVDPTRAWVVGDYLFDIQSGNAAGAVTVLMAGDAPLPSWVDQARHVIRRLSELLPLLGVPDGR